MMQQIKLHHLIQNQLYIYIPIMVTPKIADNSFIID